MIDQFDVAAFGELLIDFTVSGESAQGNSIFEANPGGARDFSFTGTPARI